MNLIYDAPYPPRVFIDTTILCGAIRKDGVNRSILKAARFPGLFHPVFSKVCLYEFMRNATNGLGKGQKMVQYDYEEIMGFLTTFLNPILIHYQHQPVNSLVGRYSLETIIRENRPIGEVLVELSGCTNEEAKQIVETEGMSQELRFYDQDDFHVWVTAIKEECQFILTSNTRRFPEKIGNIESIHPRTFYEHLSYS